MHKTQHSATAHETVDREEALLPAVLELLDEHRAMAISTLRPDGWPQATMVGYVHDGLTVFFAVARTSQKLANILHDNRVSIALGHQEGKAIRGLSMAGRAIEFADVAEVERLNTLMRRRYPGESPLAPREGSTAVFRITPEIISIVDTARDGGRPRLLHVRDGKILKERTRSGEPGAGSLKASHLPDFGQTFYRPGAPL